MQTAQPRKAFVGRELERRDRRQERKAVDLTVGVVQRGANLHAAVLEDEHVFDVLALAELLVSLAPDPHERFGALGRQPGKRSVVLVGVDHDLGRAIGRLERREAVVENGDLERGERDLGRGMPGAGGTQGTVALGRQERSLLAMDRVDNLLTAQLVEPTLAHTSSPSGSSARA